MKLLLTIILVTYVQSSYALSFESLKNFFVGKPTTSSSQNSLEKLPMLMKSKGELYGTQTRSSFETEQQFDQIQRETMLEREQRFNTRSRNKRVDILAVDDTSVRHKKCLKALENYFTNDVPFEDMKVFLQAQYELTMYKTFGSILTQKIVQAKNGDTQIKNKSLQEVLAQDIEAMKSKYRKWPAFQKAAKSFDAAPMSVETFAQMLPFLQDYLAKDVSLYRDDPGKSFMLNYRDLKMLHVMAEMENMFTEEEKKAKSGTVEDAESFLTKINRLKSDKLFGKNIDRTNADIKKMIVTPRLEKVKQFMANLKLPKECAQERRDLAELYNCSVCYHRNEDTVLSLINMSREVADTLYNSLNKRTDLKKNRELNLRAPVFYYGVDSPWGRYE